MAGKPWPAVIYRLQGTGEGDGRRYLNELDLNQAEIHLYYPFAKAQE